MLINHTFGIWLYQSVSAASAPLSVLHIPVNPSLVVGDLVVEPEKSKLLEEADLAEDIPVDQVVVPDEEEEVELPYIDKQEEEKKGPKKAKEPKANIDLENALVDVTEENLHKYKFQDVVMPLVGHKTRFPKS